MHIMEGFLPAGHALGWTIASVPFVAYGARQLKRQLAADPQARLTIAASGAFAFVLSALKLPSVTGSCSHPTGTGLGAMTFGPAPMAVLGTIVLVFQALLLAHGGLTTLGANVFSMAIAGPWIAWGTWTLSRRLGAGPALAVFLGAFAGDIGTYLVTAAQLALAFPDAATGISGAFAKFAGIFGLTQLPLAVAEGLVTVVVMNQLTARGMVRA